MNINLEKILKEFSKFPEVKSIAIGGSSTAKTSDNNSDIDIYIFITSEISLEKRLNLIKKYSSKFEVGGEYFGSGDEFFVDNLGQQLDVMYWNTNWFYDSVINVWEKHYPSNGYTTCFLYTLSNFNILYDSENWLKTLQDKLKTPYPTELKENIIKRNIMLMKAKPFASYYEQIEKAIKRDDIVSINHRLAAFLASYFDIIFAKNELLHPGEKRLIQYAQNNCKILPENFQENIEKLLVQPNTETLNILNDIFKNLQEIIKL